MQLLLGLQATVKSKDDEIHRLRTVEVLLQEKDMERKKLDERLKVTLEDQVKGIELMSKASAALHQINKFFCD